MKYKLLVISTVVAFTFFMSMALEALGEGDKSDTVAGLFYASVVVILGYLFVDKASI